MPERDPSPIPNQEVLDHRFADLQDQLDRRFATERELTEQYQRQDALATSVAKEERAKATQLAAAERQRAIELADQERRNTAERLRCDDRVAMEHRVKAGDQALKNHIDAQTQYFDTIQSASKEAITKAETSNDRRFQDANGHKQQMANLVTNLLPRETYETSEAATERRLDIMNDAIQRNQNNITALQAESSGDKSHGDSTRATIGLIVAITAVLLTVIFQVISNTL